MTSGFFPLGLCLSKMPSLHFAKSKSGFSPLCSCCPDVEWHATGQSRQGYACGCVARGGKTRAFHLQVVPNNAILQPYVRGGGNVGGHNHNASNRTEQQYYGSGQAESVRESRMSDQKGGHGSGGNAYGGASSGQRGQGGGSYGLQGQAGGGYGQAGGSGGAGQHRQGSFMGNAGGAPGLQLETQREKFVLPSQPEMVRG